MLTEIIRNMEVIPATEKLQEPEVAKMEHRRKTRRGKKKRFSSFVDDIITEPENVGPNQPCSCGSRSSSAKPYDKVESSPKKGHGKKKKHLRPSYSPKAPQNSTQFLMEDHLGNQSFEENLDLRHVFGVEDYFHPNQELPPSSNCSPSKESVSTQDNEFSPKYEPRSAVSSPKSDLEFDYEIVDDWDSRINFYEQDFEEFYKNVREAELATKTRDELIENVVSLEKRLNHLEKAESTTKVRVACPTKPKNQDLNSDTLLDLQNELKMLQEENQRLLEEQKKIV